MSVISPAILAETPDEYKMQIDKVQPFAERIQIDISDGIFTPNFLINAQQIWWPKECLADIHAIVQQPAQHLQALISLKPNMVIFHAEAEGDLLQMFAYLKQYGIKAGVALLRPTVPSKVEAYIKEADHVMIFSGDLGKYGGTASLMQLEKVRLIKKINPEAEIGWDGGVNLDNAYTLTQGGVNVLNVGGAIQNADNPQIMYKRLVDEINKQGVI